MHYFNLLVTKEIVKTLNIIGHRLDREEIFGFSELEEKKFYEFLIRKLNITKLERMRLQGVPPMEHSLYLLESELEKCHETMVKNLSLPDVTTAAYISEMSTFLSGTIPYMKYRKIVFLLDDLSNRQIPDPVQKILNNVVLFFFIFFTQIVSICYKLRRYCIYKLLFPQRNRHRKRFFRKKVPTVYRHSFCFYLYQRNGATKYIKKCS